MSRLARGIVRLDGKQTNRRSYALTRGDLPPRCPIRLRSVRRHLLVVPQGSEIDTVQRWRHTWDPVMASVVPPHVTLAYPEETADEALLLYRAEHLTPLVPPVRLRLDEVFAEEEGRGGVFLRVADVDGGWAELRGELLADPMTPIDFPAHLTLVHPRTSKRGADCRAALAGRRLAATVWVREVLFTETTADTFTVLRRFPLSGTG
ncbi:2'-5' RNA ligase family protein [Micromonospora sp. DT229]|uniref:2'-5' RNA ligase family protein n=1 Tax=Micromonospora sp. DT229 TaxID=3393430 RepID=UPI003CED880E